jgi:hypothetical protein
MRKLFVALVIYFFNLPTFLLVHGRNLIALNELNLMLHHRMTREELGHAFGVSQPHLVDSDLYQVNS